jgi:ABC-2 type transport system permease protein
MAAQSIVLADRGEYLAALPWLLGAALLVPLTLYLWAVILDRGITSAESAGAGGRRGRRRASAGGLASNGTGVATARPALPATLPTRNTGWRPLSHAARAIAWKDIRYFWRDPQLKAALISVLFATVFILVPGLFAAGSPDSGRFSSSGNAPWTVLLAPLPALFVVVTFGLNALGMDRQGLQILFLLPVRPLDILWGKNVFVGVFAFVLAAILTAIKAATTGGWSYAPLALTGGLAAILVMLGCGNVTSVITPFRWRQMRLGESSSLSTENGCLRAIISLVALAVTVILLIPVAIALLIPLALDRWDWLIVSLPLAVVYGLTLHQITSRLIAPVLQRRVPEFLAVAVREV